MMPIRNDAGRWATSILHQGVFWFQAIRRAAWFVTRPKAVGVHGIAITPQGKVILVVLSYAHGWRLPGEGGRRTKIAKQPFFESFERRSV